MFGFLKKIVGKVLPAYGKREGPCSRFGGVKAFPASPEEAAAVRRLAAPARSTPTGAPPLRGDPLAAARDAAWRRAWLKAQDANLPTIEWRG